MSSSCSIESLRRLKEVLSSNDAYKILGNDVDTWLSGGCQLLAESLKRVFPFGEILCIYEAKNGADKPEHCVFHIDGLYLDGDGVQTQTALLTNWREKEGLENPLIGPYHRQPDWHCPPDKVDQLADFLQKKLLVRRTSAMAWGFIYKQSKDERPTSSETICAWCNRLIDADTRQPKQTAPKLDPQKRYSHLICTPCRKKLVDEVQEITARRQLVQQEKTKPQSHPTTAPDWYDLSKQAHDVLSNASLKTSLASPTQGAPVETEQIKQIVESAYLDMVNEFRQHNINNSSLDGACLEASVWLKLELGKRGVRAELVRYPRMGHWAVQTPVGVVDPTIAWWKEDVEGRPADAAPNSLYWVQKTSPHTKWRKDNRIDEHAARSVAINDATRAFKRFEDILAPEHRKFFRMAAGDDDELAQYAHSITNNNSWYEAKEPAKDLLVPIVQGKKLPPFSEPDRRRLKALKATFGYPCWSCNYSPRQCKCKKASQQPTYIFKKYDWGKNRRWSLPVCHLAKPDNPSMSACGRVVKEPYSSSSQKPEGYFPCRYCFRSVSS